METRKRVAGVVFLAGMLAISLVIYAGGSLEPSAPPGPIMKTLDEVEPRIPVQLLSGDANAVHTIDQPGSYYFTGDIVIEVNDKNGITVEVNDVTIDLMGYSLIGPDSGTRNGIYITGRSNVEIRNGTVRDFGNHGIFEDNAFTGGNRVIGVRAVSNQQRGICLWGKSNLVKDCTAMENTSRGIYARTGCTVTGNKAYNNGGDGICAYGWGCTVTGNTAHGNGNYGIYVDFGSTVTGNTAYNNSSTGISAGNGSTVIGNTAYNNSSTGISAGDGSTVSGNTAYQNQQNGIYLSGNCLVDRNTAYDNNQSGGTYPNISTCSSCTVGLNHAP